MSRARELIEDYINEANVGRKYKGAPMRVSDKGKNKPVVNATYQPTSFDTKFVSDGAIITLSLPNGTKISTKTKSKSTEGPRRTISAAVGAMNLADDDSLDKDDWSDAMATAVSAIPDWN